MSQVFSPRFALVLRIATVFVLAGIVAAAVVYRVNARGDAPQDDPIEQPIPFSHQHHVRDDGIDCRYCHTSVETSAFAGIPPLATCMTCHAELFNDAPVLAPLREAYAGGKALEWNRVHDLPGFVYFDHSIHIHKGVGCTTCHGQVDRMPLMWQENSLQMEWCLGCHRNPELYVRPRKDVFSVTYVPPANQLELGKQLVAEYQIRKLTSCSTCHR